MVLKLKHLVEINNKPEERSRESGGNSEMTEDKKKPHLSMQLEKLEWQQYASMP